MAREIQTERLWRAAIGALCRVVFELLGHVSRRSGRNFADVVSAVAGGLLYYIICQGKSGRCCLRPDRSGESTTISSPNQLPDGNHSKTSDGDGFIVRQH